MTLAARSMGLLMLVCVVPIAALAGYTALNRERPGARGLFLSMVGTAGWTITLAVLAWPVTLESIHLVTAVRQVFQSLTALGWLLFVVEYVRKERIPLARWYIGALLVVPAVSVGLALTNPQGVVIEDAPPDPSGVAELAFGPWYPVFIAYTVGVVGIPTAYLLYELRSAHGPYRKQLYLLLAGWAIGVPGALNVHVLRGIDAVPSYVDLTPVAFVGAAVLWSVALFRYELFGMIPVSRRRAVETIDDPIVSVDAHGTVVDANPSAKELCEIEASAVGTPVSEFFAGFPSLLDAYEAGPETTRNVSLEVEGRTRYFSVAVRGVGDDAAGVGSVIVLQETTQLRERERELDLLKQVLSRVFRHNVRNDLTVLDGRVQEIAAADDDGRFEPHTATIHEVVDDLLAHSQKAVDLRNVIDREPTETPVNLSRVVRRRLDRGDHDADIDAALESDVLVRAHPNVGDAVEELLDNAVDHAGTDDDPPRIVIDVIDDGDRGLLVVADDGPGIGDHEIEALEAGEETDLTHGSGVGLWMVQLIARRSGGTMTLGSDPDLGGARIELAFPRVRDPEATAGVTTGIGGQEESSDDETGSSPSERRAKGAIDDGTASAATGRENKSTDDGTASTPSERREKESSGGGRQSGSFSEAGHRQ